MANAINCQVRTMQQPDLPAARRVFRLAFGTFVGHPDPENFNPDREYVYTRWQAQPDAALAAECAGNLVGSNFLAHWGSFAFFGPLTVLPEYWNRGVARQLLVPTLARMDAWGASDQGLFTFSHSPKHIALYQKFGFWPRGLTALMSAPVQPSLEKGSATVTFSALEAAARAEALEAGRQLCDLIHPGLDVTSEIASVARQGLGDTLLLWGDGGLDGLAVCHCGEGTEAGQGRAYVKFAAVRPGPAAPAHLDRLLAGVHALARGRGLARIEAGVNLDRRLAFGHMLARGFATDRLGVAMLHPDRPAFNRHEAWVLDDWR